MIEKNHTSSRNPFSFHFRRYSFFSGYFASINNRVSHLIALVRRIRYSEIHLLILSIVISAFIFPILLKAKGIVTTNTPGKLYCVKLHQDNHQAWLAVSTDYGETLEAVRDTNGMIRDSVGSIRYNPDLDVMLYSKGYDHYISHDEGVTSEYFHRASPNDWNWNLLPSQDSLIVANQYLQYSCDSLETWTRNRLIGLEGTWNTGSVGKAFGWSSGDYAVLSIFRNIDSTITKFYFSETYCDSFYVTGVLEGDWLSSNHLYPGYEPGEYYMADNGDLVNTIFYCSLDTGRTWTESGNSPINIYTDGGFDVASGWMEGELFLSWGCIDYWVDSTYFGLYHSTDYGETWELVHRMEDSEPENPEDVVERVSKFPSNYSIQAYPNPTNSSITIQLPENTTGKLYMHNNAGRLVLSQQINTGSIRYHIDLTNLPSGSYWLQYKNQTTMNSVKRIILMN